MEKIDMEISRELHGERRAEEQAVNTVRRIPPALLPRAGTRA